MLIRLLIWFAPILVIPASYLVFRIDYLRSLRYWSYVFILFIAFLFNLLSISFRTDLADIFLNMSVFFIFSEFFWYFSRVRSRIIFRILLTGAIAVLLPHLRRVDLIWSAQNRCGMEECC